MKKRYHILDEIRGITLCSMIGYHAVWDLVYMFGMNFKWYQSDFAYVWQQSICWSFIILSGFCFSIGKKKFKRGSMIFGAGIVISLVTEIFMPENRIRFGVLTLLGSSMLIMSVVEWVIAKYAMLWRVTMHNDEKKGHLYITGVLVSFVLFVITKRINYGYLGFANISLIKLPQYLYHLGDLGNYLGVTEKTFYSTDYFSLLPWFFLFLTGYFLHKVMTQKGWLEGLHQLPSLGKWWRFFGRHSLSIYMLHQPIIYGVLWTWFVVF